MKTMKRWVGSGAEPFVSGLLIYWLAGLGASVVVTGGLYALFASWLNGLYSGKSIRWMP